MAPVAARLSGPMAAALDAGRERFNSLFQQASRATPSLDGDDFSAALAGLGGPVVDAAEAAHAGSASAVTAAVYEAVLALVGRGIAAEPVIARTWTELLTALAPLVAVSPAVTIASVTNGAWNLAVVDAAGSVAWLDRMAQVATVGGLDVDQLQAAGLVAAWRSGLAHGRPAALAAARELPADVARAALGLDGGSVADTIERLAADRWAGVGEGSGPRRLAVVARVGAFRGFGGQFLRPPTVEAIGAALLVRVADAGEGADGTWELHADRFGATLVRQPAEPEPGEPPASPFTLRADGTVVADGLDPFLLPPESVATTSWAATADALAVTTDRTHAVLLIAAVAG